MLLYVTLYLALGLGGKGAQVPAVRPLWVTLPESSGFSQHWPPSAVAARRGRREP